MNSRDGYATTQRWAGEVAIVNESIANRLSSVQADAALAHYERAHEGRHAEQIREIGEALNDQRAAAIRS